MTSIFETPWFLLTAAAILLGIAGLACQIRPQWKRWPFAVPLLAGTLAFGLDCLVKTDAEQIREILNECRKLAVQGRIEQMQPYIADTYADPVHRSKEALLQSARAIVQSAGLERVVERGHTLKIDGNKAVSQVRFRVHLNSQKSQYAVGGSLLFVFLEFQYVRQPDGRWQIQQAMLLSVNDQPMGWKDV
jgi:hypothetical protein